MRWHYSPFHLLHQPFYRPFSDHFAPHRDAWRSSRTQGFDQIAAGAEEYGWDVDRGALATIWRAGCIIRARFLNRIRQAFDDGPGLTTLLTHAYFRDAVAACQEGWRTVVAEAARDGIPVPGFTSALAYYDGLRAERLPAALIQGMRDRFGSHTYRRVDRDGASHTFWSEDGREEPVP